MLWTILALIISYAIGSIPTAYLFGRWLKGIDIREHGSGNVGATNALRVLGRRIGITVLLLDILKGSLGVFAAELFRDAVFFDLELFRILMGVACICGHNWTIFLRFKGGKGIATSLGVLIGLAFTVNGLGVVLGLTVLIWILIFALWRYVSLASVIASLSLVFFAFTFTRNRIVAVMSLVMALFVLIRHKSNISRLLRGEEAKIRFTKKTKP